MYYYKEINALKTSLSSWEPMSTENWEFSEDGSALDLTQFGPLFGQTACCGLFGISDDYIQSYQSLDERFVRNKASTFFFIAAGDSMNPLILEKDILIVDRSKEPLHNRVVVVSLNGEMYCKRLLNQSDGLVLHSDNPEYKAILITDEIDLVFFGVVIGIARDLCL